MDPKKLGSHDAPGQEARFVLRQDGARDPAVVPKHRPDLNPRRGVPQPPADQESIRLAALILLDIVCELDLPAILRSN
jgi:hypothetical protein